MTAQATNRSADAAGGRRGAVNARPERPASGRQAGSFDGAGRLARIAAMRLGFVDRLRERLYAATAHAGWPFLVRRRQSDLLHALTHDVNRAGQGALCVVGIAVHATFALAQGALAVVSSAA